MIYSVMMKNCVDGLSNYSCVGELVDGDSSDDGVIRRPSSSFQWTISSRSDSSPNSDDPDSEEEWSSTYNPIVLEEFWGLSGITTENIKDSVVDAVALFTEEWFFFYILFHQIIKLGKVCLSRSLTWWLVEISGIWDSLVTYFFETEF